MKRQMTPSLMIVSALTALYYVIPANAAKHKILEQEFNDVIAQPAGQLNIGSNLSLSGVVGGFLDQDVDPVDLYQVVVMKPQTVAFSLDSDQPTTQLRVWVDKNRDRRITAGEPPIIYESVRKSAIVPLQPGAYIVEINDGIPRRKANYSVEVASVK
ncbi:hypothetical protein AB3R30_24325 [Leptolyngbyaceae cyanobacterium UHCC 1019]